jgi:hypothetical protein
MIADNCLLRCDVIPASQQRLLLGGLGDQEIHHLEGGVEQHRFRTIAQFAPTMAGDVR